jgi:hypothetical protein
MVEMIGKDTAAVLFNILNFYGNLEEFGGSNKRFMSTGTIHHDR